MGNTEQTPTLMGKLSQSSNKVSHSAFLDAFEAELNMFGSIVKAAPSSPQEKNKLKTVMEKLEIASTAPASPEITMDKSKRLSPRTSLLYTINRMINLLNKSFETLDNNAPSNQPALLSPLSVIYDYVQMAEDIATEAKANPAYSKNPDQTKQLFEQLSAFVASISSEYIIISRKDEVQQSEHNIEQLKQYQGQLAHFQEQASGLSSTISSRASTPETTPRKNAQEQFKPSSPEKATKRKVHRVSIDLASILTKAP